MTEINSVAKTKRAGRTIRRSGTDFVFNAQDAMCAAEVAAGDDKCDDPRNLRIVRAKGELRGTAVTHHCLIRPTLPRIRGHGAACNAASVSALWCRPVLSRNADLVTKVIVLCPQINGALTIMNAGARSDSDAGSRGNDRPAQTILTSSALSAELTPSMPGPSLNDRRTFSC